MSDKYTKAIAKSMQQTKEGVAAKVYDTVFRPVFDISEPMYMQLNPDFDYADTETLVDLWRVRFGDADVGHYTLARGDSQWKTIAHVLWKRSAIVDIDLIKERLYPDTMNNEITAVRERRYRLR